MDYTLAKRLKDAGFPQKFKGSYWVEHNGKLAVKANGQEHYKPRVWTLVPFVKGAIKGLERTYDNAYCPTLSELIEACGSKFRDLCYRSDEETWFCNRDDIWNSQYPDCETPEEAVAKLWLALHKPKKG